MTETAVATLPEGAALAEQVVIKGDLSKLSEQDRMRYYSAVCSSLGLNPLTRPFEYISLNGKLTLYATRAAGDQLRATRGITITNLEPRQVGELFVVTATGRDRTGREDASTGAVSTAGLRGEALANAMMKAETKAKRRLTLSLAGLGWTDETEVDSIPGASIPEPPASLSLAEKAAQRAAEVAADETAEEAQAIYDGDGLFSEAEAPKLRLTTAEFIERINAAGIDEDTARAVRVAMFGSAQLTDENRGALWLRIETERAAAQAVPSA